MIEVGFYMAIQTVSKKRFNILLALFTILFLFTIIAWQITRIHFKNRFQDAFATQSKSLVHILKSELTAFNSYLYFGNSFVSASENVTRAEFNHFYSTVIENHNNELENIHFIAYVEKVTNKDDFEKTIKAESTLPPRKYTNFSIYPDTQENESWVVKYVTSEDTHKEYLGYDILTDSNFTNDFITAAESNKRVFTNKKIFINRNTALLIQPIYNSKELSANPEELKNKLKGFIVIFLNLDIPLANQIDDSFFTKNVSFSLYLDNITLENSKDYVPIYTTSSESLNALNSLQNNKKLQYIEHITVADKQATVIVETFQISDPKIFELSILDIGFIIHSLILGILLLFIIWSDRTNSLGTTNGDL